MRAELTPHPDTPCAAVRGIAVDIERDDGALALRFALSGDVAALRLPESAKPIRTDGLWRSTCFEAFVMAAPPAYREFNLSPSGAWAAYRFDAYRAGMADLDAPSPEIAFNSGGGMLELFARVPLPGAARLGLSAVIETRNGAKSYWALTHPPGPPDFHHRDCFALELPAVESSLRGA